MSIADLRELAKRRLPRFAFDIVDGAADDEVTYRANRQGFEEFLFHPRPLVDVSTRDQSTIIFGERIDVPVILGPSGAGRLAHPLAELAVARAAADAGTISVQSSVSTYVLETVASSVERPPWYQLYLPREEADAEQVVQRVAKAGYRVLVVTIDTPVHGNRERDRHNRVRPPISLRPHLLFDLAQRPGWALRYVAGKVNLPAGRAASPAHTNRQSLRQMEAAILAAAFPVTWDRLKKLRDIWTGPLVVKGIMRSTECGRLIEEVGIDGLVVSNHGGRQLDGLPATVTVLPEIAAAVDHRIPIFLDGGIRRGTDVVKALALGATACLVVRPWIYGLAAGGPAGVSRALEIFREEIDRTFALLGCCSIEDIGDDLVSKTHCPQSK